MRLLTVGCFLVAATLLVVTAPEPSSAAPLIVGRPPYFLTDGEPKDTVVHDNFLIDVNGTMANLVLYCLVSGEPTPTITWYRENVALAGEEIHTSNGTLTLNVTENDGASRVGVLYHCRATNTLGPEGATITATIRSRNARVAYAYFDGFPGAMSTQNIEVVTGSEVALRCDVPDANPPPIIRWADENGDTIVNSGASLATQEMGGGRYLYLTELDAERLRTEYHCEVTNVRITETELSKITYTLSNTLNVSMFVLYKPIGDLVGIVGERVSFLYVAGHRTNNLNGNDGVTLECEHSGLMFSTSTTRVSFIVPQPMDDQMELDFICVVNSGNGALKRITVELTIVGPAAITSPEVGDAALTDRDVIMGGSSVTYTCVTGGLPIPTMRWYYNGDPISASLGVTENGNMLTIPTPVIGNSGIYQCFVSNTIDGNLVIVQRAWILEVRRPRVPTFQTLSTTNPLATEDRLVGTLLIHPVNTTNVLLRAEVNSDPCPDVQWQLNGTNITSLDGAFSFDNPCLDNSAISPYNFSLTILALAKIYSGNYSAIFNNRYSTPSTLPEFFVTVPVEVEVLGIRLEVEDEPSASCLLSGSNVTLTCDIVGYPRPQIIFSRASIEIDPSMDTRIADTSFDQITISNTVAGDDALYSCKARLMDGMTIPLINAMDFEYCTKPVITSITSTKNPVSGEQLELQCHINGIPTPVVTWLKDDWPLSSANDSNLRISTSEDRMTAIVSIATFSLDNNGVYICVAKNSAASVNMSVDIQVPPKNDNVVQTIIISVVCVVGGAILLIIVILLLVCIFKYACKPKGDFADFHPYNVDMGPKGDDNDGRGNVDADSFDGNAPEAFNPEYESLPTRRPLEPPPYKATPGYGPGPNDGDDMEMIKYPPQDSESFVAGIPPYSIPPDNNGFRPSPDDFMSEDAQFV